MDFAKVKSDASGADTFKAVRQEMEKLYLVTRAALLNAEAYRTMNDYTEKVFNDELQEELDSGIR